MADSMEHEGFDVEAQETLLGPSVGSSEVETTSVNARKAFHKIFLLIRSAEQFKLAAAENTGGSSSTTASGYDVIGNPDQEHILIQDSGDEALGEIPSDAALERSSAYSTTDENEQDNQLQRLQRESINEIVREKSLDDFRRYGGVEGVAEALNTDLENGIPIVQEDISQSKAGQTSEVLTTFFLCLLGACNNYTVFLLTIAAALHLFFGIKKEGLAHGWYNGAVLLLTVFALIIFPTIFNFLRERSPMKLENSWQSKGREMKVQVVRGGRRLFILANALQVGDIAILRKGDQIPADGIFVAGQALELDRGSIPSVTIDQNAPFIFYPSRVINGNAKMIVTSTGMDTVWGETMSQAIQSSEKKCKFEACLHKLNTCTHFAGLLISILIVIVLFLRYQAGKLDDEYGSERPDPKGEPTRVKTIMEAIKEIITGSRGNAKVLTTLLSVSLLGIMEGIPFVISIAIDYWTSKTLAHIASERDRLACIKMASVTTICSDKFGGLAEQAIEIDKFFVGGVFVHESTAVASDVLEGLCDGISTILLTSPNGGESKVIPLKSWAEAKLGMKEGSFREQCRILSVEGCDPFGQCCQVLMEKSENEGQKKHRLYTGPPRHILSQCSHYYDIEGNVQELDGGKTMMLDRAIGCMLTEEADVIAFAREGSTECDVCPLQTNCVTFMGMISLRDTKREDTRTAISTLKRSGIRTIIASGDDVEVLKTIRESVGVLTPESDNLVVTGKEFRDWSHEEKMDKIEKICIIGNCLPSDKILLIRYLRDKGEVVALLAQQTVDAPALRQADVGLTCGSWSSEIARECCDICIWDADCFNFLANVIEKARCFQENIRKFIQLQLIVTISSSLINFTATVLLGDSPITAIQLSWLNLVVAFVGGLALLTEPSTKSLMTKLMSNSSGRLITKAMWRNIAIQASYQTTIFVTLQHKGQVILGTSGDRVKSMIYNGFFLCQAFNKFIAREPEKKNIFRGLFQKSWFWVALFLMLTCQAAFAVAEKVIGGSPWLTLKLWGACILIALVSWLLDLAGKLAIKCHC